MKYLFCAFLSGFTSCVTLAAAAPDVYSGQGYYRGFNVPNTYFCDDVSVNVYPRDSDGIFIDGHFGCGSLNDDTQISLSSPIALVLDGEDVIVDGKSVGKATFRADGIVESIVVKEATSEFSFKKSPYGDYQFYRASKDPKSGAWQELGAKLEWIHDEDLRTQPVRF
jgi:hypothetical protein